MNERLYRSRHDRMIAGVAGGLAEIWDVDPSIVRIVWVVLAFLTGGLALLVYIVMAIVVPDEDDLEPWETAAPPPTPGAGSRTATDEAGTADASAPLTPTSDAPVAPDALWAPSPAAARRQARREARAARRSARGDSDPTVPLLLGAILVVLGGFFLLREFIPAFDFDLFWPIALIGAGVILVAVALRPDRRGGASGGGAGGSDAGGGGPT